MSEPRGYRTITRRAALTLAALLGSQCLQAQTAGDATLQPAAKKPAPTFHAAGIQGTIAPSGYSDGASEEQARQVASLIVDLQAANYADQSLSGEKLPCDRQAELLHASLEQPDSFEVNSRLGLFYLQHGRPGLSVKYLSAAKQKHASDPAVARDLAMAEIEAHDYAAAGRQASQLLQRNPSDAFAHQLQGSVEAAAGQPEAALAEYKLSATLDPGANNAFSAGLSMMALGFFVDAEKLFAAATATHPNSVNLWLGMGIVNILEANHAQAVKSLLRAAALDPSNGLAPTLLATLTPSAEQDASLQPEILPVIEAFAAAHPEQAIAHYDYALALSKASHGTSDGQVGVQMETELKLAITEQPQFAAAHFQLGIVYEHAADLPSAINEFSRAVTLEPDVAEWRYRLARAFHQAGQNQSAELEMVKFKQLAANRDAGKDVSAKLLDGLPPELLGVAAERCEAFR